MEKSRGVTVQLASGLLKIEEKDDHVLLHLSSDSFPRLSQTTSLGPEQLWTIVKHLIELSSPDAVWGLIRHRMTTELYTRDEAFQLVAEQTCRDEGHDFELFGWATIDNRGNRQLIRCVRCNKQWAEYQ